MNVTLNILFQLQDDLSDAIEYWGDSEETETLKQVIEVFELIHQKRNQDLDIYLLTLPNDWSLYLCDVILLLLELHKLDKNYDSVLKSVGLVKELQTHYEKLYN